MVLKGAAWEGGGATKSSTLRGKLQPRNMARSEFIDLLILNGMNFSKQTVKHIIQNEI